MELFDSRAVKPHISLTWSLPVTNYILLGLLLPLLFLILASSIRISGIVKTDVAERLSLFIPILASFFLFDEKAGTVKIIGIALAFAAIVCTVPWHSGKAVKKSSGKSGWIYLAAVFAGMGIIDILLKQIAAFRSVSYNTSLVIVFILAFVFSFAGMLVQIFSGKMRFSWPHILIGWVLGAFNFGNILFYIKAHQVLANKPSVVFSVMNIGVIVAGAFTGMVIFREKLSLLNKIGLAVAIIAIFVMAQS
jgi:drug/metabolite transporter (DMT)-like permease